MNRKILIPLLRKYYLFDFFKEIVARLLEEGFHVVIVTFDEQIERDYANLSDRLVVAQGPRILRYLNNRSGRVFHRVLLWLWAWGWAYQLKRHIDFVILPWDTKPILYAMSRVLPAMICHTTTDMVDVDSISKHTEFPDAGTFSHRVLDWLDRSFGLGILPRLAGRVMMYEAKLLLVDRLMGYRTVTTLQGFSGPDYMTVSGEQVRKNFVSLGIGGQGERTKISVVGSPAYERVFKIRHEFDEMSKSKLRKQLGIPEGRAVFSMFLSPSSFTDEQIEEIGDVAARLRAVYPDAFLIIKLHPKTRNGEAPRIRAHLGLGSDDLLLITEFGGDEFNAKLILLSECLLQKQSTVGFIAMLLSVPIISYNLRRTDYSDDLYKSLGASFHAESAEELESALNRFTTVEGRVSMARLQDEACRKFCIRAESPCGLIAGVLKEHFVMLKSGSDERKSQNA